MISIEDANHRFFNVHGEDSSKDVTTGRKLESERKATTPTKEIHHAIWSERLGLRAT
jgi:hypothetical protein